MTRCQRKASTRFFYPVELKRVQTITDRFSNVVKTEGSYDAPVSILGKITRNIKIRESNRRDSIRYADVFYTNEKLELQDLIDNREVVSNLDFGQYELR